MKFITKNCLNCNDEFKAEIRYINRGHAKFCSRKCSGVYNGNKSRKPPNVECAYCNKRFFKNKAQQKNSKSGLFFCCRKHKDAAQRLDGIKAIHPPQYGNGLYVYRKLALNNLPHKCNRCEYNRFIQTLVAHHIDHDRSNNQLSNMEILCRNCHWEHHLGLI